MKFLSSRNLRCYCDNGRTSQRRRIIVINYNADKAAKLNLGNIEQQTTPYARRLKFTDTP